MSGETEYGEAWAYESIVGALPWIELPPPVAVGAQFAAFETGVLLLAWWYGLPAAAIAGTIAVAVAAAGSAAMLVLGARIRALPTPEPYRRVLFGSSIEVVLGLLAYVALLTYLFAYDPRDGEALLTGVLGPRPPVPALYLALLILWDVCYRIGTGWWAAVAAFYRSWRVPLDPPATTAFRRVDALNAGFGLVQLALVPLVAGHPILLAALLGHVVAVLVVVAAAIRLATPP